MARPLAVGVARARGDDRDAPTGRQRAVHGAADDAEAADEQTGDRGERGRAPARAVRGAGQPHVRGVGAEEAHDAQPDRPPGEPGRAVLGGDDPLLLDREVTFPQDRDVVALGEDLGTAHDRAGQRDGGPAARSAVTNGPRSGDGFVMRPVLRRNGPARALGVPGWNELRALRDARKGWGHGSDGGRTPTDTRPGDRF
ncbi:hypothetical protein GCM10010282_36280 [Streptomyces roseolus]|nr:hypothetical protein GCM10010282_36280 [Streptomyces roseolus]